MSKVTGKDPFDNEETVTQALIRGPKKRKRDLPHRMTYYLPEELCEEIREIAHQVEVPISDVAHYALRDFVERYRGDEIELEPKVRVTRKKLV